jgi:hypothetical protein
VNELLSLFNSGASTPTTIGGHTYTLGKALVPAVGANVNSPPLPTPATLDTSVGTGGQIDENSTKFTLALGAGGLASSYDYLLVKWANTDAVYDIQGLTGTLSITNDIVKNKHGVPQDASHADLFNPHRVHGVPDNASTAALLGVALIGIGFLGRKISRNPVTLA